MRIKTKLLLLGVLILLSCGDEANPYDAPSSWGLASLKRCDEPDGVPTCVYSNDECVYTVSKVDGVWTQDSFSCMF